MKLIPNAGRTALRSYSMWANYLGIAALVVPELIYWRFGIDLSQVWLFWIGLALIVGGSIGRLIDQGGIDGNRETFWVSPASLLLAALLALPMLGEWPGWRNADPDAPQVTASAPGVPSEAGFLAESITLVGKWEGPKLEPYLDTIASPPVWTWCYGETQGPRPARGLTKAECDALLGRRLLEYRAGLHGYFTAETRAWRLTAARDAAMTSTAYNVGVTGFGKSTSVRRLNAGDIEGACEALTW